MDISDTLAPNSDQLDAVDLVSGPRVFTITKVEVKKSAEQPVSIHFAEFPRPWRPGKNMRRVLAGIWSANGEVYVGRRVELFCDTTVVFGGQAVGGVRIRAMSHIDKARKVPIIPTRGKSALYTVQPLPDAPAEPAQPSPADLAEQVVTALADATTEAEVREWGNRAHAKNLLDVQVCGETVRNHVTRRLADLTQAADDSNGDNA